MAMDPSALALELKDGLGFSALPTSSENSGFAVAIVGYIASSALVNNPPGTITGSAPGSGGPLSNGAGSDGVIVGMTGSGLASMIASAAGYPGVTAQLTGMASGIVQEFLVNGKVSFASGNITGTCSNTPLSPGALVGAGTGGKITGMTGSSMANFIVAELAAIDPDTYSSVSAPLAGFCNKLVDYVQANAEASYLLGTVTGVCSAGGGPISGGTGAGGKIL